MIADCPLSRKKAICLKTLLNAIDRRKVQALKLWHYLTGSLWFVPGSWMFFSVLLAVVLVALDSTLLTDEFWEWAPWFLIGNASGARTMLGSISSAMLTVTSLAFSLMMVTVVQTANSYTPRIIGQFLGDRRNQNVLGILLGTFLYSLLVLRAVNDDFVPLLAVNVSILFAVISTIALVSFINHVAQSLKVSNIAERILSQAERVILEGYPSGVGQPWTSSLSHTHAEAGALIYAQATGYLQLLDGNELLEVAEEAEVIIKVLYRIGEHVLEDAPLAEVWPADALDETLVNSIHSTIAIGRARTEVQDARFAIRQLVDIALRALSPGINDPTTAVDMINALKRVLALRMREGTISHMRADETGTLRLILPVQTLDLLLDEAFVEILHYGGNDFATLKQVFKVIGQLRFLASKEEEKESLWRLLTLAVNTARENISSDVEFGLLNESLRGTTAVFERELETLSRKEE